MTKSKENEANLRRNCSLRTHSTQRSEAACRYSIMPDRR